MWQGEKHGVCQVHTAGLFIDGNGNDVGVHRNGAVPTHEVCTQLYGRVFSTQELSQTPVNDEHQLCQPWEGRNSHSAHNKYEKARGKTGIK